MNDSFKEIIQSSLGKLVAIALFCGLGAASTAVRADDAGGPSRAIRLSSVEGEVHLSQGKQTLSDQALVNTPLFEGTRITTGNDGRAEIQFEDGSVGRLSPGSSMTLTVLRGGSGSEREGEISVDSGLGYFEIQGESDSSHLRIRFGDAAVTGSGSAVLRVNLDKLPGELAVFSGNAHVEIAGNLEMDIHGGESVALNSEDPNNYRLSESIEPDSWDSWNSDRDQALTQASAGRTPATENLPDNNNPAWGDLDANGNWYDVPDQGYVWSPNEASNPGWDPYGDGNWMYNPGYGYQYISGETWGYLPYQCGTWNYFNSFGWGWAPGMCQPWWGGGGGLGFVINIGYAPPRYHYPVRPPRPHNPRPGGGPRAVGPEPVIRVNHRILPGNTLLPPRDRSSSVMIAGNVVKPLRPAPVARVPYNRSSPAFTVHPTPGSPMPPSSGQGYFNGSTRPPQNQNTVHPGYFPPTSRQTMPVQSVPRPSGGSYTRPYTPMAPAPRLAPAPAPRSAPPPASHPSGGGGGGGGSHPVSSPHH